MTKSKIKKEAYKEIWEEFREKEEKSVARWRGRKMRQKHMIILDRI